MADLDKFRDRCRRDDRREHRRQEIIGWIAFFILMAACAGVGWLIGAAG